MSYLPARYRYLATTGDINPLDYDGGYLVRVYPNGGRDRSYVQIEVVQHADPDADYRDGGKEGDTYELSCVDIPRNVLTYHNWIDVDAMAKSCDFDPVEWRRLATSRNVLDRARCVVDIAGYYGWHELDNYPNTVTRADMERRWRPRRDVSRMPGV